MKIPSTINDLHQLTRDEILNNAHVIIGSNGQCMCGIYDGIQFTCKQILTMKDFSGVTCDIESGDGSDT